MLSPLPVDLIIPSIKQAFVNAQSLVISAAPGAGKTTRIPPALSSMVEKQVWVLEPRRIAAISAAQRIADENGWVVGQEVGYQVRFDNKFSVGTKILFLTEALLLRKLLQDPDLRQVACVVLDEFHERSLHVDMALGALKELQELSRPDLKIVVMSATLDASPLSQYLGGAPVIDSPGKVFPLEIIHDDKPLQLQTGFDFIERMRKLIHKAIYDNSEGDVLCFLPGRGEIERLKRALEESLSDSVLILPLHGQLSLVEQKAAILPSNTHRKIILSTNLAESSLTVEGVRIVVDCGLARLQMQDQKTGFESLKLAKISKASATQRAGRAARLGPGRVYRAWTIHDEKSMHSFETAEIHRVDLSEALLLLAAIGVTHSESFAWFELPPARSLQMAKSLLLNIGAITTDGGLTELGQKLQRFPLHPRLAKLLIVGLEKGVSQFTCELAALLSEGRAIGSEIHSQRENDLMARWEEWKKNKTHPKFKTVNRAVEQLQDLVKNQDSKKPTDELLEKILLEVYPDRLCRRRRSEGSDAKMVGGRGVRLHQDSSVKNSLFFVALEISEGRDASHALVFQAAGIHPQTIEEKLIPEAVSVWDVEWDEEKQKFYTVESLQWRGLAVSAEKRRPALPDEIKERLVDVALQRWDSILQKNDELSSLLSRIQFLHTQNSEWPLLDEEKIREALTLACYGENSLAAVEQKKLDTYFENSLEEKHLAALKRDCPTHWTAPTGNRFRIQYTSEQGPQVEVRLQELFGLKHTPSVAGQPVTLTLLAPNYRPVQVTRDIESFWKNAYMDVRKEMRARYPKHSWPEDPLNAAPQSKGRPHK
ncbi:MAG: ATP-dependent helicase HrpB [Bdellovibrionales bacterium]|nr:ATP-dependent helicase HrpB [Bdellovibrionales bacterium]